MTNMRENYIYELIKEIRGPRLGTNEILPMNPYSEYITGVIIPKSCKKPEITPDSEQTRPDIDEPSSEDGNNNPDSVLIVPSELDPKMKPKSFGISFTLEGENPELSVCLSWARYFPTIEEDQSGNEKIDKINVSWKRSPHLKIIRLTADEIRDTVLPAYEADDGKILLNIRAISSDRASRHIILSLVNDLKIEDCKGESLTKSCLFQPSIRVNIIKNGKLISFEKVAGTASEYVYTKFPVLARGHMCSAVWKDVDYQHEFDPLAIWPESGHCEEASQFLECDIRSEFVPLHSSPAPEFDWDSTCSSAEPVFSARKLSELWNPEEMDKAISPLLSSYRDWIENQNALIQQGLYEDNSITRQMLKDQDLCYSRLEAGLKCIKEHEDARLAFCFANRAILIQNIWKKGKIVTDSDIDFLWRPFQLAFFLTSLESMYNRNSEYRNTLDLLWVPTGGGKTEAYLAMMAFAIALRRRKASEGKISDAYDQSGAGVSIITRYTLRLLTVQQFRRTLIMTIAAEYLRVKQQKGLHGWRPEECPFNGDWLYGMTRFSTGMWVGGKVSPNHLRGEYGAIKSLESGDTDSEPAQIVKCPVCGAWLSIPNSGLSEGKNSVFLIIQSDLLDSEIREKISQIKLPEFVLSTEIVQDNIPERYYTLKICTSSRSKIQHKQFDEFVKELENTGEFRVSSFRPSRPGYFPVPPEPSRQKNKSPDFEIYCTNPECDLNTIGEWSEANPGTWGIDSGVAGMHFSVPGGPFAASNRMPIPAYTTDEQVYHRCPTVIVSTADKIARLAYDPRAGAMFGSVTRYNRYYGYLRGDEDNYHPSECLKSALSSDNTVKISPFMPPDLIVQDELHLMDGPLGSMFGLYESVVDGLITQGGGKPKYVASSATVNNASSQVRRLFNRETLQFPPYGLSYKDSFFTRYPEDAAAWDETRPGRIYIGIYAPGMGPLTPIIRIWSRILQTGSENKENKYINNFWTLVGYFNSIRELGGNRSLYREDIVERISQISHGSPRTLDAESAIELSSRVDSTDIPQILEELEQGARKKYNENPDAIFTTSMFGTGVDIPHLSMMLVNGQPKTTAQYIQATGRVGRQHGALVTVFYKAGRPRDLSHYELFMGYHNRINLMVEPASVSPFSEGCLERAVGPAMVAFLRNMTEAQNKWSPNDGHLIQSEVAKRDFSRFLQVCFTERGNPSRDVIEFIKSQYDMWKNRSTDIGTGTPLMFYEYVQYKQAENHVVLGDPAHERRPNLITVFKNAPQSLRDVEETTAFEV